MSLLLVRCTSHQCQHTAAIQVPNGAWKQLVSALQDEGWVFANGAHPQCASVTRSVSAGLGRQRLRIESMMTIYGYCPRCDELSFPH
ncbi:MAG: hypothetical protein ACE5LB_06580 [Acidiferrobacterales bacterium]